MLRRLLVVGAGGLCIALPASAHADSRPSFTVPGQMRLIAYYPASNGWTYMWTHWNPAEIDRDFGLAAELHGNTVRIFVQPVAFGWPHPTAQAAAKLDTVFALAAKHGLTLELTLFDWWFDWKDVAGSETWVHSLLAPYAHDPRLAAVELRNELDPGDLAAAAWARTMIPYLHTILPGVPVTLSVSANDPVNKLTTLSHELAPVAPDFWSFHYYDKAEYAYWTLQAARAAVAPVPLVLGETGYQPGTSSPPARGTADVAAEEMRYFRTIMNATALLGMPPAGIWVLLDFTHAASPNRMPAVEYTYGLFHTDGTPKPSAAPVAAAFANPGRVDANFDGDFEQPGLSTWRAHGSGVATRDTLVVHQGTGSAELAGAGSLTTIPPDPWVTAGQKLTLTAWARGLSATGTTQVAIRWFTADRTLLAESGSQPLPPGSSDWTQLTATGTTPFGAAFVELVLSTAGNSGSARIDDVTLAAG